MFRRILTGTFAPFSLAFLLSVGVIATPVASFAAEKASEKAADKTKSAFTDAQLAELNAIMKQYILDNPQALITSVETYYNKQNDTKKAQEGRVDQVPAGLYDSPGTPYAGDKNAKFVIVEFFDYNCGYCKQVSSDVKRIIDEEKTVKFIFKELPILSEMSEVAARYALAANMQGKYLAYHEALMAHQGPLDPTFLEKTGKEVGLDTVKLKKDADTQEVRDVLAKNIELARTLGIRGTPFFLVGKTKVPGAIGYSKMKELILQERDGVTVPTAPTPDTTSSGSGTSGAAAAAAVASDLGSTANADEDVKKEAESAKQETGDMLRDLQKQAEDMKRDAEAQLAKLRAEQEAQKAAASSGTTATTGTTTGSATTATPSAADKK